MTLPEKLFARIVETGGEEDHYIDAEEALDDLDLDDDAEEVGEYHLVKKFSARKRIEVTEKK